MVSHTHCISLIHQCAYETKLLCVDEEEEEEDLAVPQPALENQDEKESQKEEEEGSACKHS